MCGSPCQKIYVNDVIWETEVGFIGRKERFHLSHMHRIQWFDHQIREGKYPNSKHLAQQFEISRRQAQRDIEYLEVSLRAPLLYVAKNRGYCYEDKTFVLPLLYMTEEEKKVLKFLAYRYQQYDYDNAGTVHRVAHLLGRFTDEEEAETHSRLPVFDMDPGLIENHQLLSHAIQENLVVHMTYEELGDEDNFQIYPFKLIARYHADYVVAYCVQQKKQRTFRLDRIGYVTVTDQKFERITMDSQDWNDNATLVRQPFTAKIILSQPLDGDTWRGYPVRSVHNLVYEIDFYNTESFLQHLLVTEWVQILSPKWLTMKLQSRCLNILDQLSINQEIERLE